jgi:tetratricopeptide (TPR) repeat protein
MQSSYALDWIRIHEESDRTSLSDALEQISKEPESIDNIYLLALVYLNVHKDKEAAEAFSKILSKDPKSIEAKWGLAEVMRRQQKIEESEKALKEIIKSDPEFWPAHITLAYVQYTKQEFEEAVKIATKVSKADREGIDLSNYVRAYLIIGGAKGMIASRGGPFSKIINGTQVLPNLKKAEKLQPDSAAVSFGLGSFYFLAPIIAGGNRHKAQAYLEKTIEADPLFADAYVRLAQLYKMLGDDEKSWFYLDKALEIDPQNTLVQDFKTGKCKFACITVEE